jgi:hypothetical protein
LSEAKGGQAALEANVRRRHAYPTSHGIQVGDRLTDAGFEWEVVTHPAALHGGKSLRARIQGPGLPETERDMTWPAHARIKVSPGTKPAAE